MAGNHQITGIMQYTVAAIMHGCCLGYYCLLYRQDSNHYGAHCTSITSVYWFSKVRNLKSTDYSSKASEYKPWEVSRRSLN